MKLIVTADDFAITFAGADGVIHAATYGCLTETGLFSNSPAAEYGVKRLLSECPDFCLGQDINLVTGRPLSDPERIPSLVDEEGNFRKSGYHRMLDKTNPNHIPYEEAYIETEAQILKFIDLVGKKPAYLNGHSYGCENTHKAFKDLAVKYEIPVLSEVLAKCNIPGGMDTAPWNAVTTMDANGKWDFSPATQLDRDPLKFFTEGKLEYLNKALEEDGIAHIHTHTGFVDRDLVRLSSFNLIRMMEADFVTSSELNNWIKENNVELISVRDLL
ncbi:MAG: ChbG/HpnK family deacetylase [Solobacterium sp.]|nr:ChbG/HpnK family deacetylase [Solobacterium sp.]